MSQPQDPPQSPIPIPPPARFTPIAKTFLGYGLHKGVFIEMKRKKYDCYWDDHSRYALKADEFAKAVQDAQDMGWLGWGEEETQARIRGEGAIYSSDGVSDEDPTFGCVWRDGKWIYTFHEENIDPALPYGVVLKLKEILRLRKGHASETNHKWREWKPMLKDLIEGSTGELKVKLEQTTLTYLRGKPTNASKIVLEKILYAQAIPATTSVAPATTGVAPATTSVAPSAAAVTTTVKTTAEPIPQPPKKKARKTQAPYPAGVVRKILGQAYGVFDAVGFDIDNPPTKKKWARKELTKFTNTLERFGFQHIITNNGTKNGQHSWEIPDDWPTSMVSSSGARTLSRKGIYDYLKSIMDSAEPHPIDPVTGIRRFDGEEISVEELKQLQWMEIV